MIYEEILLYHFEDFRKDYELKKAKGQSVVKHIVENENSKLIVIFFFKKCVYSQLYISYIFFPLFYNEKKNEKIYFTKTKFLFVKDENSDDDDDDDDDDEDFFEGEDDEDYEKDF